MTAEQFAYWLQGYSELTEEAPSAEQWQMIRDHLQTVFVKVTPRVKPLHDSVVWSDPVNTGKPLPPRSISVC